MVVLALALALLLAGCGLGPLELTPEHPHGLYVHQVWHGDHVAFLTDRKFSPHTWPIACSVKITDHQPPWYAQREYLRCPVCGLKVQYETLSWRSRQAELGPPRGRREPHLMTAHGSEPF